MVISRLWQGCAGSAALQLEAELSSEPGTDRKGLFCFAQWLLRSCPTAKQRARQGTSKAHSLVLSPHSRSSVASGRPAPGTLSLTPGTAWSLKYRLQQETHCSQSQGKEDRHLKSLCHLTRNSKSHPRNRLCLQGICAGRRAGHSCDLSPPCC